MIIHSIFNLYSKIRNKLFIEIVKIYYIMPINIIPNNCKMDIIIDKIYIKYFLNFRVPVIVEEDDGNEILISYKEGTRTNEWINKDSSRIHPKHKKSVIKEAKIPR